MSQQTNPAVRTIRIGGPDLRKEIERLSTGQRTITTPYGVFHGHVLPDLSKDYVKLGHSLARQEKVTDLLQNDWPTETRFSRWAISLIPVKDIAKAEAGATSPLLSPATFNALKGLVAA